MVIRRFGAEPRGKHQGAAMSGSLSPFPVVSQGAHDHPVRTVQDLLNQHGHGLVVDGVFGPLTDAAVRAFQQTKGLGVDGIVGPITWGAVIVTVKQGSQGDAVRGVQEEFQFRNLSGDPSKGLVVDGVFGSKTDAAVRGFQQALHADIASVVVDGIVGPVTWQALVSGMLSF
jgi:peptidoglycan hydrolase-like protein with peptidoglycan-binding domain